MVDPRRTPRQLPQTPRPATPGTTRRVKLPEPPEPPPPPRSWARPLAWVLAVLVLLMAVGRALTPEPELVPAPVAADTTPATEASPAASVPEPARARVPVARPTGPSPIDMMVRAESQRRIVQAGRQAYFDSLLAETDSSLRHWTSVDGSPVRVAVVQDSLYGALGAPRAVLEDALARWNDLRLGVELQFVDDPGQASIVVEWLDRADPEDKHLGQALLSGGADGTLQRASISLPAADGTGRRLTRAALLLWATHQFGHALGLAHSDDPADVMFSPPRTPNLSERDRRTALLLYGLPPGSVKGQ